VVGQIQQLEARKPGGRVAVTASTGIAASHISGSTLHSFAGIGMGKGPQHKLVEKVLGNAAAVARWRAVETLVVDEVSMLDSNLIDALEAIARAARGSTEPFGGVQLILCGASLPVPFPAHGAAQRRARRAHRTETRGCGRHGAPCRATLTHGAS
jgi:ATP-dependent DNA helicase PIF1